ncbi:uncharacterized protein DS421_3g86990 [Arachis hypogaea]|nr:uncharacterized protein DS421_3g86990 [Arachis hypogaea]
MPPASLPSKLRDTAAISRGKDVRRGSQVRKGETSTNQIRGEGAVSGSCRHVAAVVLVTEPAAATYSKFREMELGKRGDRELGG